MVGNIFRMWTISIEENLQSLLKIGNYSTYLLDTPIRSNCLSYSLFSVRGTTCTRGLYNPLCRLISRPLQHSPRLSQPYRVLHTAPSSARGGYFSKGLAGYNIGNVEQFLKNTCSGKKTQGRFRHAGSDHSLVRWENTALLCDCEGNNARSLCLQCRLCFWDTTLCSPLKQTTRHYISGLFVTITVRTSNPIYHIL
jgi:hypothetical protein